MTGNPSQAVVTTTRKGIHDLMNHLCVAMGNSELLLMELPPDDPRHAAAAEIRDACTSAMTLVQQWSPPQDGSK